MLRTINKHNLDHDLKYAPSFIKLHEFTFLGFYLCMKEKH